MIDKKLPAPQPNSTISTTIDKYADTLPGRSLRAIIAAIPLLGSSISVFVEAHLSARQAERINSLYDRIAEIEQGRATPGNNAQSRAFSAPYSESLLENATNAAARTDDSDRAAVFANILYFEPANDPTEVVRRHLIEICTVLTRYELALLLSLSRLTKNDSPTEFARLLMAMRLNAPDLEEVHTFSLARLATFRLIDGDSSKAEVTTFGRKVLSVI